MTKTKIGVLLAVTALAACYPLPDTGGSGGLGGGGAGGSGGAGGGTAGAGGLMPPSCSYDATLCDPAASCATGWQPHVCESPVNLMPRCELWPGLCTDHDMRMFCCPP